MRFIAALACLSFSFAVAGPAFAQDAPESAPPDADGPSAETPGDPAIEAAARLREAVGRIDPEAEFFASGANFSVLDTPVTLVYDVTANRMRLVAPVADLSGLDEAALMRLMQANFDSALDARYAVAQGVLWSTFIHELTSLSSDEFGSGLGQTVNLVHSYGTTFSSGALVFGGGDSAEQQRELIEDLQDKSRDI